MPFPRVLPLGIWVTLIAAPLATQGKQDDLPAWLQASQPTLERGYTRGIEDAGKNIRPELLAEKMRRSLGQLDPMPLREEAESSVWLVDPFVQAYQFGWKARHDDWSPEQIRQAHDDLVSWAASGRQRVTFQLVLNVLRKSAPGPIAHPVAPAIFHDLRVEMRVAGRRYDPEREPGDLPLLAGPGTITTTGANPIVPPRQGRATGPGEIYAGNSASTNYFTVYRTDKFDFYQANVTVVFDLFNSDGTPRVRPKDVGIGAIVTTSGADEHEAKFGWNDLMAIRV